MNTNFSRPGRCWRLLFVSLLAGSALARAESAVAAVNAPPLGNGFPWEWTAWCVALLPAVALGALTLLNAVALRRHRLAPPLLVQSLQQIIHAGNYQEAWEACHVHPGFFGSTLKAGLERIGRGKAAFDGTLIEHATRATQRLRGRNGYLQVIGIVAPLLGVADAGSWLLKTGSVSGYVDLAYLTADPVLQAVTIGFATSALAFALHHFFRNRVETVAAYAMDRLAELVEDLPFEELQGVRVGENFSAGSGLDKPGKPAAVHEEPRRVSMALTTNCPVCNAPVQPGENPCPRCGGPLEWKN